MKLRKLISCFFLLSFSLNVTTFAQVEDMGRLQFEHTVNVCGDEVLVSGIFHTIFKNKGFHITSHGTGISLIDGTKYIMNDTHVTVYNSNTNTFLQNFTLVPKGGGDKRILRFLFHLSNSHPKVTFENSSCWY